MVATLLLVGGDNPADPNHLHDVRQDLVFLPHAYTIVHVSDVDGAQAWCQANREPLVIAYTDHVVNGYTGTPRPLTAYGDEVVVVHGPADLTLWDEAERMGAGMPITLDQRTGLDQLVKHLVTAAYDRR